MSTISIPQSTIEQIVESERQLFLDAEARHGEYYIHARATSIFLSRCIEEIKHDRMMFAYFFAHLKKHHMLSLLSIIRLHQVQGMMDLRQVLEAGAGAAFAIANTEQEHFVEKDKNGILTSSDRLTKKRYKWLDEKYPRKSASLKYRKSHINLSAAHANIISGDNVLRISDDGKRASAPFFDFEDQFIVRIDLWLLANVALELMELFSNVDRTFGSLTFHPCFKEEFDHLVSKNNQLFLELRRSSRFVQITQRYGITGT